MVKMPCTSCHVRQSILLSLSPLRDSARQLQSTDSPRNAFDWNCLVDPDPRHFQPTAFPYKTLDWNSTASKLPRRPSSGQFQSTDFLRKTLAWNCLGTVSSTPFRDSSNRPLSTVKPLIGTASELPRRPSCEAAPIDRYTP